MRRVCIIAAGGSSSRTGLGIYTTKAALPLVGRSLLSHQIEFANRCFGAERVVVIARPEHACLLGRQLSQEDRSITAFVLSDCATGWAGEVERAAAFVGTDDEVLLISCDNLHQQIVVPRLGENNTVFTHTSWRHKSVSPTNGVVLARCQTGWVQCSGTGFTGDLFTGYIVVRGNTLLDGLREVPFSERGEKEITALLETLSKSPKCLTIPYPGEYVDVADLNSLARIDARLRGDPDGEAVIGAGVLLHKDGRVLLTERADGQGWCLPGGIVEPGESFSSTAVREVKEEIGLCLDDGKMRLLGVYSTKNRDGGPALSVVFYTNYQNKMSLFLGDEVRSTGWFDGDSLKSLTIPFNMRLAIDDYFAGVELDVR